MTTETSIATHPVAWLRPLPKDYRTPLWRWILIPASALLLKRNGGVWLNGELRLMADHLLYVESKLVRSPKNPPATWRIKLEDISGISLKKGMVSQTLEIEASGGLVKLMTVRSEEFVTKLEARIRREVT
ncbi:PH domain-containing protein [Oryzicola mucosus]|uniref:PH domain-containing protein n=1 Tax=Oryzicola mucosus TaxID=2767425 RepID=A0A8J6PQB0_9HYPH|nr:hypothetical protein [Oryzicola mucosus]MBD0413129.1 hypothetical protein [Oryzicola mucosus]